MNRWKNSLLGKLVRDESGGEVIEYVLIAGTYHCRHDHHHRRLWNQSAGEVDLVNASM